MKSSQPRVQIELVKNSDGMYATSIIYFMIYFKPNNDLVLSIDGLDYVVYRYSSVEAISSLLHPTSLLVPSRMSMRSCITGIIHCSSASSRSMFLNLEPVVVLQSRLKIRNKSLSTFFRDDTASINFRSFRNGDQYSLSKQYYG